MKLRTGVLAVAGLATILAGGACTSDEARDTDIGTAIEEEAPSAPAVEENDESGPLTFTKDQNEDQADLTIGEEATVDLETCVGCGYEWKIMTEPDPAVIELAGRTEGSETPEEADGDPMVGGRASESFVFRATGSGTTLVTIGHFPPGASEPEETFTLNFSVS